jgi:hypothetical protein
MLVAELKESKLLTSSGCWVPGKADHSGQGLVDFKSRMTISSTPKVEPFGKTVSVCVYVCEGISSYRHCTGGGCKGPGNISRFPTPLCKLLQWSWKCLKVPHPSVQSFTVDAGNILSVPTPVCKLFQWMLEMSQASPPQCTNFFS